MTTYTWLGDEEIQREIYQVVSQALSVIEPAELPFLDGFYENYIDLAQEGDVVLDPSQQPFNFTGTEDVVSVWLVPLVIEIANSLILATAALTLKKALDRLRHSNATRPGKDDVRACVHQALDAFPITLAADDRDDLERALVQSLHSLII